MSDAAYPSPPLPERPDWEDEVLRFEEAWQSSTIPDVVEFLRHVDSSLNPRDNAELLAELVKIDMEYRWRAAADTDPLIAASADTRRLRATLTLEDYGQSFPEIDWDEQQRLELAAEEFRVRHLWGDRPAIESFQRRFPHLDPQLTHSLRGVKEQLAEESATPHKMRDSSDTNRVETGIPQIDGYEVMDELGRGGMGVVYLARDVELNRIVALKLMRFGRWSDDEQRHRFRQEVETVAQLQNAAIVQVFAVGQHEGQPFCALEFMPDGNLAARLNGQPLTADSAAQLVETLARGVHTVHRLGVIHRDLKPANVLLAKSDRADAIELPHGSEAGRFEVKISDFGLAKRLAKEEASLATETGAIVGTPSYMAPEQATGQHDEITSATDVYALGAILYELLCGRPPFRAASALETLEQLRTDPPLPLRRIVPRLPVDLETICLKCLSKRPGDRFQSALDLADELQRFRRNEPIHSRPVSAVRRLAKWIARRPATAALIGVTCLALATVSIGSLIYSAKIRVEAEHGRRQRDRANDNFERAFAAVNRLLDQAGFSDLQDVPEMQQVRRRLLSEALEFYESLLEQKGQDAEGGERLQRQYITAHHRLALIQHFLGKNEEAEVSLRRCLKLLDDAAHLPQGELDFEYGSTLLTLGLVQASQLKPRDAADTHRQAATRLTNAVRQNVPGSRRKLAAAYNHLGNGVSDYKQRLEWHQQSLALRNALRKAQPENADLQSEVAMSLYNIAFQYQQAGKNDEARQYYEQAIPTWLALRKTRPGNSPYILALAECHSAYAYVVLATGESAKAVDQMKLGLELRERLVDRFPTIPEYRDRLARSRHNLSHLYLQLGRLGEAEESIRIAADLHQKLAEETGEVRYRGAWAEQIGVLALVLAANKKTAKAEETYQLCDQLHGQVVAQTPATWRFQLTWASNSINFGNLLRSIGHIKAARERLDHAVKLLSKIAAEQPNNAEVRRTLLSAHGARAQTLEAATLHIQASKDWERVCELATGPARQVYRISLALALARGGQARKAVALANKLSQSKSDSAEQHYNLACVLGVALAVADSAGAIASEARDEVTERAVALLRSAGELGMFRSPAMQKHLATDADLISLRRAAGFQKLLAEVQAKK